MNKGLRLILLGALLAMISPLRAEDAVGSRSLDLERAPFPMEAAEAVFGRVFGVQDQGGDIDYYTFNLSDHNSGNAALRSVLIPGWGQAFNGEPRKGLLLLGTTAILGTAAYLTYADALDSYDTYKASGRRDHSSYDDYNDRRTVSMMLTGATAIFWGYAIYDAAKYGSPRSMTQGPSLQVVALPDQAHISWHKRF